MNLIKNLKQKIENFIKNNTNFFKNFLYYEKSKFFCYIL